METNSSTWNPALRVIFRFLFCYLMLYALGCGNATVWWMFPFIGLRLEGWLAKPFQHAAQFAGQHLFHLHGVAAHLHPSGYNDRALDWIAAAVMLALALIATPIWSVLDRRRTQYRILFAWLRFTLRLSLAVGMLVYGVMKLFPFQIAPPSLAVLNENVGSTSPLTLLWTVLGFSPLYERICGCVEILGALLLLYRRTALAGALLAVFVLINIVLFDLFFDVPVKLYAFNLLLMALVLIAPDARALVGFFWSHRPSAPTSAWAPPVRGRWRFAIVALEALAVLFGCVLLPLRDHAKFAVQDASLRHSSQLSGQWYLDSSILAGQPHPFLTGDGQPLTDIFLEPNSRVNGRAADHTLWPGAKYDAAHHSMTLMSAARLPIPYAILQPDPAHLILIPVDPAIWPELHLTRVPLPTHYPLYERGFHWVNEWGFER